MIRDRKIRTVVNPGAQIQGDHKFWWFQCFQYLVFDEKKKLETVLEAKWKKSYWHLQSSSH